MSISSLYPPITQTYPQQPTLNATDATKNGKNGKNDNNTNDNNGVAPVAGPTVNTSGQTTGLLINTTA